MKYTLLLIVALSGFFLPEISLAQVKCIPFHLTSKNKKIVLDHEVKGIKMKLLFDTGATINHIDFKVGERLGMFADYDDKITIYSLTDTPIELIRPKDENYVLDDSLFYGPTFLTDMEDFSNRFVADEQVDGLVGTTYPWDRYILEFDFKNLRLCFWDALPEGYLDGREVKKTRIVRPDCGSYKESLSNFRSIMGRFTVEDTVTYLTNFVLDTGVSEFLILDVYDSLLLERMLDFKAEKIREFGDDYPTTRLTISDLGIDSLYTNAKVLPKCIENKKGYSSFGVLPIGGYLGMQFMLQYEKVLLDERNKMIYFVEKR